MAGRGAGGQTCEQAGTGLLSRQSGRGPGVLEPGERLRVHGEPGTGPDLRQEASGDLPGGEPALSRPSPSPHPWPQPALPAPLPPLGLPAYPRLARGLCVLRALSGRPASPSFPGCCHVLPGARPPLPSVVARGLGGAQGSVFCPSSLVLPLGSGCFCPQRSGASWATKHLCLTPEASWGHEDPAAPGSRPRGPLHRIPSWGRWTGTLLLRSEQPAAGHRSVGRGEPRLPGSWMALSSPHPILLPPHPWEAAPIRATSPPSSTPSTCPDPPQSRVRGGQGPREPRWRWGAARERLRSGRLLSSEHK